MMRLQIAGLCTAAVVAACLLTGGAALASLPQYEVAKKSGGGLEPLKKAVSFVGKGGTTLLRSSGPTIECQESRSKGRIAGPKTETKIQMIYRGCGIPSLGVMCASGKKARELFTNKLKAELVYLETAKVGAKVGLLFKPEGATPFMAFKCSSIEVVVTGSVIAEVVPANVLVTTDSTVLSESSESESEKCGKQLWQFVEGEGPCHHLESLGGPDWNIGSEEMVYKTAIQVTA